MIKVNGLGVSRIPINGKETLRVMKNGEQLWSGTGLPNGYTLLEYIESTGTQYIDTGFVPNQDTRVVIDCKFDTTSSARWLFGARQRAGFAAFAYLSNNGQFRTDYNNSYTLTIDDSILTTNHVDKNKNITVVNDSETISDTYNSFNCECYLVLFAINTAGNIHGYSSARIMSCQIYNNGELVRDFIPCMNPEGICGLFDKVNREFYQSATSTPFTGG